MAEDKTYANKFLDQVGLSKLWELTKTYIDKHPQYEAKGAIDEDIEIDIPNVPGGGSGSNENSSYIPWVESESELSTLPTQDKGELALILSDSETIIRYVKLTDLPASSVLLAEAAGIFNNLTRITSININENITILPYTPISSAVTNIPIFIIPENAKNLNDFQNANGIYIMISKFGTDGYIDGDITYSIINNGVQGTAKLLATFNKETKKINAEAGAVDEINELLSDTDFIENPAITYSDMSNPIISQLPPDYKNALVFFECEATIEIPGTKSIRIKNDNEYSRLDSDVIKVINGDNASHINYIDLPNGSILRTYSPDTTLFFNDLINIKVCKFDDNNSIDISNATVIDSIDFPRNTTCVAAENLSHCSFIFINEEKNSMLVVYLSIPEDEGGSSSNIFGGFNVSSISYEYHDNISESEMNIILAAIAGEVSSPIPSADAVYILKDDSWNEEAINEVNNIISSGVKYLYNAVLGDNLYNNSTGNMYFIDLIESVGSGSAELQETLKMMSELINTIFGMIIKINYDAQFIPEHVETYSKYESGWVKDAAYNNTDYTLYLPNTRTDNGLEPIDEKYAALNASMFKEIALKLQRGESIPNIYLTNNYGESIVGINFDNLSGLYGGIIPLSVRIITPNSDWSKLMGEEIAGNSNIDISGILFELYHLLLGNLPVTMLMLETGDWILLSNPNSN